MMEQNKEQEQDPQKSRDKHLSVFYTCSTQQFVGRGTFRATWKRYMTFLICAFSTKEENMHTLLLFVESIKGTILKCLGNR
jgi:hypothetical protein